MSYEVEDMQDVQEDERERRFPRLGRFFLAGALAATAGLGYVVYKKYECFFDAWEGANPATAAGMLGCVLDDDPGAHTEIGGIGLKTEDIIDKSVIVTFGTVSMQMAGTGRFAYNGSFFKNLWGVDDVVWYYNPDNEKTTEVRAVVGTRFSENYETGLGADGPAQDSGKSVVKVDVDYSADGRSVDNIAIDAGTLDLFWPHIPTTLENSSMLDQRGWAAGSFGDKEWAANNYAMETLLIDAALAQSCPEDLLEMEAVDDIIKTVVRGELTADPAGAAMISQAFEDGKVTVEKDPPTERKETYQAKYTADRESFMSGKAFEEGLDLDMEISEISVRSCDASGVGAVG